MNGIGLKVTAFRPFVPAIDGQYPLIDGPLLQTLFDGLQGRRFARVHLGAREPGHGDGDDDEDDRYHDQQFDEGEAPLAIRPGKPGRRQYSHTFVPLYYDAPMAGGVEVRRDIWQAPGEPPMRARRGWRRPVT